NPGAQSTWARAPKAAIPAILLMLPALTSSASSNNLRIHWGGSPKSTLGVTPQNQFLPKGACSERPFLLASRTESELIYETQGREVDARGLSRSPCGRSRSAIDLRSARGRRGPGITAV